MSSSFLIQVKGFFIAFFITFIALLSLVFVAAYNLNTQSEQQILQQAQNTVEIPKAQSRLNMVIALQESVDYAPEAYILLGFLPDNGQIAITVLPPKSNLTVNGSEITIQQMFSTGGMQQVQTDLSTGLAIPIEKHAIVTSAGLASMIEYAGFMSYNVTAGLNYPHNQRQVMLSVGNHLMDGRKVMDIICYPAYTDGEQERSDRGTMLLTNLLNQYIAIMQTDKAENLIKTFLNNSQNNLSITDYHNRAAALTYLATQAAKPVTPVYIEGALSPDYKVFNLTGSFLNRVKRIYSL